MPLNEIDRSYETSFGHLTVDQMPKDLKWESIEALEEMLPSYRREYLKLEKGGEMGKLSRNVEIDNFNLRTPYNDRDLFRRTKLYIEPNKRCAVYGENGSGKTMLFKAISEGRVKGFPKWMSTHHMREMSHDPKADNVSVIDTVTSSHPELKLYVLFEKELKKLIEAEGDKESEKLTALQASAKWVADNMQRLGGHTAVERAQKMLRVLGFDEVGENQPMSALSGGLRMRVALASAFFIDPDLMLLDEPTNHLDLPSVLWLENKLRGYKGSFLLVTHDRNLLENVVTSVYQLQDCQINMFACDFASFERKKKQNDIDRDKMIDKFMKRNRNLDPTSPLYKTKMEYAKWQEGRLARSVLLQGKFTFQSPKDLPCDAGVEQKDISLIKVDNVRFSYDEAKGLPFIFDNPISYEVKVGTRVGVMGPNGAGKSTFLKLITGKIFPTTGTITTNPDYTLAYFGQHSTKELSMEDTPEEFMQKSFPKANKGKLMSHLGKTSVTEDLAQTRMKNLSFSQRSCVIFAKLTFVPPHLLIMDEPTNFLDLDSVDSLIKAANGFKGGLITVTHNRDFLKRCSRDFLSIVPGAFNTYESMKEAERATYSFISAMEAGEDIDHKNAIVNNRGGGAKMTEEETAARDAQLKAQALRAKRKADKLKAEEEKKAAEEAERVAKIAAKQALMKDDWKADEECWAPVKGGKWGHGTVVRNIPGMGVSVKLDTGKQIMLEAKKLRLKNPAPESEKKPTGGRGGGRGGRGRGAGGRGAGGRGRGRGRGNGGGRGRGRGNGGGRGRGNGGRGRR